MARQQEAPPADNRPFLKKSIIWERKGPLPVWGWMAVVLALVLIFVWWRRNSAAGTATEAATGYRDELPGDQTAPPIFIIPPGPQGPPGSPGPAGPTGPAGPVTVAPAPPAGGAPPPLTIPSTVPAEPNVDLYEWVAKTNRTYGTNLTFTQLFGDASGAGAMNPGYRKYIKWHPAKTPGGALTPMFNPNWSGRNPPLGIPPVRIR